MSSLEVGNCTLYGNGGQGIGVSFPLKTSVSNSILSDNQEGSLSGLTESEIFSSLIGDGQFTGINGNRSGFPLLKDPANFSFTPSIGSPVIDVADNSLIREGVDLYSHVRIVDGDADGVATGDLGALEFASDSHPPLRIPNLSVQPGQWFGLAITNARNLPAIDPDPVKGRPDSSRITMRARNLEGRELGVRDLSVPLQTQDSWLITEYFQDLEQGWIELMPAGPDVVSFALLGNWETTLLDGVPLTPALGRKIVFPEIRNGSSETTTLFLVNPGEASLPVTLTWKNPTTPNRTLTRDIPPRGMLQSTIDQLFGSGTGGFVIAESLSDVPIYGLELFGTQAAVGTLVALDFLDGSKELYAAQMASSDNVRTILNLINIGSTAEEIQLEAISEQGTLLTSADQTLPAGAQLYKSAKEIFDFSSPVVGWVRVRSSSGMLIGTLTFEDPSGRWLSALPLQSEPAREFVLSHVAHTPSIFTGVTLLNPGSGNALISFEIFSSHGEVTQATHLVLPSRTKRARLLNEWIPEFQEQSGGFIRIRSSAGVFGFELFGSYDLEYVSAVPQQVTVY